MNDIRLQIESIELSRHLYALQQKREELEALIRTGRETIEQSSELLKGIDDLLAKAVLMP
jgi:hypothetical protein